MFSKNRTAKLACLAAALALPLGTHRLQRQR
jgi:hypothetical protein